jgi:hypothetical protein
LKDEDPLCGNRHARHRMEDEEAESTKDGDKGPIR